MKVLGVKVTDEEYHEFASLKGTISDNLRTAIELYWNHVKETRLTKPSSKNYDDMIKCINNLPNPCRSDNNADDKEIN